MLRLAAPFLVLCLAIAARGRVYDRCSLANDLMQRCNFARDTVSEWVCLVEHESGYDTAAYGVNTDGSNDNGLFQVSGGASTGRDEHSYGRQRGLIIILLPFSLPAWLREGASSFWLLKKGEKEESAYSLHAPSSPYWLWLWLAHTLHSV